MARIDISQDIDVDDFYYEMSDSEKKEMGVLLLEEGVLSLEKIDDKKEDMFSIELQSVFNEIAEMKHLPLLQIANEIREKYL